MDAILKRLRDAFPAEPIRGDAAFAEWGGSYPDAEAYTRVIDGKTWEQLDRSYLLRRHDALGFLSTRELVQVLPIYLLSLVEDGVMSPALDTLLVKLARPSSGPSRERFDGLQQMLSRPQREMVAHALRVIVDQDPDGSPGRAASEALEQSWSGEASS